MSDLEDEIVKGLRPSTPKITFTDFFLEFSTKNGATEDYVTLMEKSWDQDPSSRPSFDHILAILNVFYEDMYTKPSLISSTYFSPSSDISFTSPGTPPSTPPLFSSRKQRELAKSTPISNVITDPQPTAAPASPSPSTSPPKDSPIGEIPTEPLTPTISQVKGPTPRERPSPRRTKSVTRLVESLSASLSSTGTPSPPSTPSSITPRTTPMEIISPRKPSVSKRHFYPFSGNREGEKKEGRKDGK
jgi:hypothetical protein